MKHFITLLVMLFAVVVITTGQNFTQANPTLHNLSISQSSFAHDAADYDWGDYDSDGDLDLVITGMLNVSGDMGSRIFRNDGNNVFYDIRANLAFVDDGQIRWADFDNDGDLDLLIVGAYSQYSSTLYFAQLYRNDGNDTFSIPNVTLHPVTYGRMALGDYDNDGKIDIVYTGRPPFASTSLIYLYKNLGNWQFQEVTQSFTASTRGELTWVDYNRDGLLDLFVNGSQAGANASSYLYKNTGSGFQPLSYTFPALIDNTVPGVSNPGVSWGDYDKDGLPDLFFTSLDGSHLLKNNGDDTFTEKGGFLDLFNVSKTAFADVDSDGDLDLVGMHINSTTLGEEVEIFLNNGNGTFSASLPSITNSGYFSKVVSFDHNNDNKPDLFFNIYDVATGELGGMSFWDDQSTGSNNNPTTPSNLTHSISGNALTLSWNASTDVETPAGVLEYEVRIGTAPGKQDLFVSSANANGTARLIWTRGNAGTSTTFVIPNFPKRGDIYWSVQALDQDLGRSAFAPEQFFNIPNVAPVINGQAPINIDPSVSTSHTIVPSELYVSDPDNSYPTDFIFSFSPVGGSCNNFSLTGNVVTETSPSTSPCRITAVVNDGNALSPPFDIYVSTTRNTNPQITGQQPIKAGRNIPFQINLNELTYNTNGNAVSTLVLLNGPNYGISGNTVTPATDFTGSLNIPVMVQGTKVSNLFDLAVTVVDPSSDQVPVIVAQASAIQATENQSFAVPLSALTVTDADNTFPYGFSVKVQAGTNYSFSNDTFTPSTNFNGPITVMVVVNDGISDSAPFAISVTVSPANSPPATTGGFGLFAAVDLPFTFQFPPFLFVDPENDAMTYTMSEVSGKDISWLTFNPATLTLSGTPHSAQLAEFYFSIRITATDVHGASGSVDNFLEMLTHDDSAPYSIINTPDQVANPGVPYSYQTDVYALYDDESNTNALVFTLKEQGGGALPAWLNFNPWTQTLSGTPSVADAGTIILELTAFDENGMSGSETFNMTVTGSAPPTKNVTGVSSLSDVNVVYGTAFDSVSFPPTVQVTYDDASTENLAVNFEQGSYSGNVPATYALTGMLTLSANTTNNASLAASVNVIVARQNQTIAFDALPSVSFGDANFAINAAASSGLGVSYSSSNSSVATVSGNTVTIVGGGSTTITASQGGDSNYNAAASFDQTLTVNQASQTITFNSLPAVNFGDSPFNLTATASSGLTVNYTSSNTAVATISGNVVTILTAGSTTITASQTGNNNYSSAADVAQLLSINEITGLPENQSVVMQIYPNPVQNEMHVVWPSSSGLVTLVIYQADGKEVDRMSTEEKETALNVGHYSNGLYILSIQTKDASYRSKFIKQ